MSCSKISSWDSQQRRCCLCGPKIDPPTMLPAESSLLLILPLKQGMGSVGHRGAVCAVGPRQLPVLSAPKRKVAFKSRQCWLVISMGLGARDWCKGLCFVWAGRIFCLSPVIIICPLPSLSFPFLPCCHLPFLLRHLPFLTASSSSSAWYFSTAALEARNNLEEPCSLQKSFPHEKRQQRWPLEHSISLSGQWVQ